MLILDYPSKKALREHMNQPLRFQETSVFGPEYKPTGSNRPHLTGHKREFFANVLMMDGLIAGVK